MRGYKTDLVSEIPWIEELSAYLPITSFSLPHNYLQRSTLFTACIVCVAFKAFPSYRVLLKDFTA